MLIRGVRTNSSSCSQVIFVHLYLFRRNSLFCKTSLKHRSLGFKTVQIHRCWHSQEARRQCLLW